MHMKIERLPEPELLGKSCASAYCKTALLEGPYSAMQQSHKNKITVGIVGLKHLLEKTKEWINLCNGYIESKPHTRNWGAESGLISKYLFPDFPGMDFAFESKIIAEDSYIESIILSELGKLSARNKFRYIEDLLSIFEDKIKLILNRNEDAPDVILCVLSDEMYDICHVVGDYHRKLRRREEKDTPQLNLFQDFDSFSGNIFSH